MTHKLWTHSPQSLHHFLFQCFQSPSNILKPTFFYQPQHVEMLYSQQQMIIQRRGGIQPTVSVTALWKACPIRLHSAGLCLGLCNSLSWYLHRSQFILTSKSICAILSGCVFQPTGGTVVQWVVLLNHNARDLGMILILGAVWMVCMFVLWTSSGCSDFIPYPKDVQIVC